MLLLAGVLVTAAISARAVGTADPDDSDGKLPTARPEIRYFVVEVVPPAPSPDEPDEARCRAALDRWAATRRQAVAADAEPDPALRELALDGCLIPHRR